MTRKTTRRAVAALCDALPDAHLFVRSLRKERLLVRVRTPDRATAIAWEQALNGLREVTGARTPVKRSFSIPLWTWTTEARL